MKNCIDMRRVRPWLVNLVHVLSPHSPLRGEGKGKEKEEQNVEGRTCSSASHVSFLFFSFFFSAQNEAREEKKKKFCFLRQIFRFDLRRASDGQERGQRVDEKDDEE